MRRRQSREARHEHLRAAFGLAAEGGETRGAGGKDVAGTSGLVLVVPRQGRARRPDHPHPRCFAPSTSPAKRERCTMKGAIITGVLTVGVFFGGLGTWSMLAPLDSAVVGTGALAVHGSRKTVQHREGGIVAALL